MTKTCATTVFMISLITASCSLAPLEGGGGGLTSRFEDVEDLRFQSTHPSPSATEAPKRLPASVLVDIESTPVERPSYQYPSRTTTPEEKAIENRDIYLGMSVQGVRNSWGEPDILESNGAELEKWTYTLRRASPHGFLSEKRNVYFRDRRVIGWETF